MAGAGIWAVAATAAAAVFMVFVIPDLLGNDQENDGKYDNCSDNGR